MEQVGNFEFKCPACGLNWSSAVVFPEGIADLGIKKKEPELEYRVWVVQDASGKDKLPRDLPVLSNVGYFVKFQLEHADRFLDLNSAWRTERTDERVTRRARTSSEACVLRLLRRVREGQVKPESLHLHFHDQDSQYERIPVTEDGDLVRNPPLGFFDWRDSELF
jgi:hypothetical protein